MMWTWRNEPELMRRLTDAQNAIDTQDIMTIVAFFTSHAQLVQHVEHYESRRP